MEKDQTTPKTGTPVPGTTHHEVPRDTTPDTEGLFVRTCVDLHRGDLLDTLDDKLAEVVQAVTSTGKGGTVTLTIGIKPAGKNDPTVFAAAKVSAKVPEHERAVSLFYADGGNLLRNDPNQTQFDLR